MKANTHVRRYRQLLERAAFDLKLAQDAERAAGLPDADLTKIRREIDELLRKLGKES